MNSVSPTRWFYFFAALLMSAALTACGKGNSVVSASESATTPDLASPNGPTPIPLVCDATRLVNYGGGSGTAADPYNICSPLQWNYFANDSASWGKYFRLWADLDFTGYTETTFKSIGNSTTAFTGNFDGNGYRIKNLTIATTTNSFAIFTKTNSNANISNLILKNINFSASGTARLSGLVLDHGSGGTLTLDRITVDGLQLNVYDGTNVGGLLGSTTGPVVISNFSFNAINIPAPSVLPNTVAGVLGRSTAPVTMSNVSGTSLTVGGYNSGGLAGVIAATASFTDVNITGLTLTASAASGGLACQVQSTAIVNRARLAGSVTATNYAGGLIEELWGLTNPSATVTESSFTGNVNAGSIGGGLISINYDKDISIIRSFYNGNLGGQWHGMAGGLIGSAQVAAANVSITDSYAISNLSNTLTTDIVLAGLLGSSQGITTITRSYFSGTFTGSTPQACIAKTTGTASFTATDSYYNSTVCLANASTSGAIAGVTGLATGALQTSTPFTNWSPTAWTFSAGKNPKLAWEP